MDNKFIDLSGWNSKTKKKYIEQKDDFVVHNSEPYSNEGEFLGDKYAVYLIPKTKQKVSNEEYESMKLLQEHEEDNGGFIFTYVKMKSIIKDNFPTLVKSDYARLIYLSTFISWEENLLRYDNGIKITKTNFHDCLKLSRKRSVEYFKKLKDINVLYEDEDGSLYLNQKLFYYGAIKDNIYMNKENEINYIRLFKKTVRDLYNNSTTRELNRLSVIYLVLPYVNLNNNIVSFNPYEKDIKYVNPMGVADLCKILGYDNPRSLKSALMSLKLDGEPVFAFISHDNIKENNRIIVNPRVVFAGDYKQLQVVKAMFK